MSKARVFLSILAVAVALVPELHFRDPLLAQQFGVISGRAITEAEFKGVNALSRDVGGKQVQGVSYQKQWRRVTDECHGRSGSPLDPRRPERRQGDDENLHNTGWCSLSIRRGNDDPVALSRAIKRSCD